MFLLFFNFLTFILLLAGETEIPEQASEFLIAKYGLAGLVIIGLSFVVVYLVKRANKQSDKEKERLIEEKDNAGDQNIILHKELKDFQTQEIARYFSLQENTNEINKQVAGSLDKFAGSLDNFSLVFNKVIEKL